LSEQNDINSECDASFESKWLQFSCSLNDLPDLLSTSSSRPSSVLYQFDHIYPQNPSAKKLQLSGYGVELALKSTEYKAKDDTKVEGEKTGSFSEDDNDAKEIEGIVFSKLNEIHPELKKELREFKNHLLDSATELTPFKVWQLQDLGYQASQKIVSAPPEHSLQYLRDISQNFPTQARSLVRTTVTSEFKREVKQNQEQFEQKGVGVGDSLLYINGLTVDLEVYDVFTLLDVMTSEAKLVEGLHSLGFQGEDLQKFLQLDLTNGEEEKYAIDIRHSAVQFINDLATEKKYRGWPSSVQDLLRPTFPGMLRHIAKNLFHLIFVVNPADAQSKNLLKMAEAFNVHKAPLRLGIVFATSTDLSVTGFDNAGVALVRAFDFINKDEETASKGLSFITDIYEKIGSADLTAEAVIADFASQYPGHNTQSIFGANSQYDDVKKAGDDFISRTGLSGLPQVLINGVPLETNQLEDGFEEAVVMEVLKQTQVIQQAVYKGEVNDNTDILEWWMERENVLPRLNSRILAPASLRLDLTGATESSLVKFPSVASELNSKNLGSALISGLNYITKKDEDSLRAVTLLVICDLEDPAGRSLLYTAIKHLKTSNNLRLGVIFNPKSLTADNTINNAVHIALETLPAPIAKSLITKLVKEENIQDLLTQKKTLHDFEVHGMDMESYIAALNAASKDFLEVHQMFASKLLSLRPGERAVLVNGGFLGPLTDQDDLTLEDFNLLERLAYQQGGQKVAEVIETLEKDPKKASDLTMKVFNLLMSKSKKEKRQKIAFAGDKHSVIKLPADTQVPAFTIEAIVDPVSLEAQKMSAILLVLKQVANVDITIFMNPREKLSEMPLKSFYRYVLEPEVTFDSDGNVIAAPQAKFLDMPQKSLLTLNMKTPESWLVESVVSPYDLDNILLEEVEKSVNAIFELEYILIEGHCYDSANMQPPRGLQFTLGTGKVPDMVDTIVMANLGYFQLKAYPGLWSLKLRQGRSEEIYKIDSHEFTDSPNNSSDVFISVNSFKSKIIRIKVSKKPDKMNMNLLQDDDDSGGIWDSISNTITGSSSKKEDEKDSTLNIFSVASGHLYERFLRIMMLSVIKNTKSKVKFWFLKNYLSPTFKDFIPYMAKNYGFEYELVQYKWPRWLNQQKEKQRIIWGYKILFLDVLFPLDVKKIIFVDADQIVRADLQELYDLDLGGAPYGYTPFCDSRKEMDGFRFWKSGYWNSHLAGRKYHISALYVVDLKKFRRIAAGDRLRGQYQGLSQDPNSLSNLDQDLPNNMIHQVAIKSLPQEWLYCETWCSESEKPRAKTIDLCNNPLTKEPKLQAAMRIVPEWKDYDYEIKVLWDEIYQTDTKSQIEYDPPADFTRKDPNGKKEEL
ncbi:UDP-glucose:glycoprotein glucosyltransferase 1, partial [Bulinus truncatus]